MIRAFTLGLLLCACGGAQPAPTPADPVPIEPAPSSAAPTRAAGDPPAKLDAHIAKVLEQASSLRHLPKKTDVPGTVLARDALLAELKGHVLREVPKEAILREGLSMKLCGLIGKEVDYEGIMFRLLEEQLAGFYLPEQGRMYLASDLEEGMAEATLVHELIHALQDQHFDLKTGAKYKPGQSDRSFARSALAEGDATSAMADFMTGAVGSEGAPPDPTVEKTILIAMQGTMPDYAPKILQQSLVSPYVHGLKFVNALRRKGGWAAVDAAWKNPPTTSEQLLHLEKFATHEPPLAVSAPDANTFGGDFVRDDDDSLGEEGVLLMVESITGQHRTATDLARGWGGDRNAIFTHRTTGATALVMHLRYDADAKANAGKLTSALASAWGASASNTGGVTGYCKERPDLGPVAIATRVGSADVSMVFGPADVKTWRSAGSCEQALRIARAELSR